MMGQIPLVLEHSMSSGYYTEQLTMDLPDRNEYVTTTANVWGNVSNITINSYDGNITPILIIQADSKIVFHDEKPSFIKRQLFKTLGFEWK